MDHKGSKIPAWPRHEISGRMPLSASQGQPGELPWESGHIGPIEVIGVHRRGFRLHPSHVFPAPSAMMRASVERGPIGLHFGALVVLRLPRASLGRPPVGPTVGSLRILTGAAPTPAGVAANRPAGPPRRFFASASPARVLRGRSATGTLTLSTVVPAGRFRSAFARSRARRSTSGVSHRGASSARLIPATPRPRK
jgi:hypothetical protein